jgi:L-fuculose-phosphate aldolase
MPDAGPDPDDAPLAAFREAGRLLFSFGLVRGTEGNLSTFDGSRLLITRTGCSLADLGSSDLVEGGLDGPAPEGSSSDVEVHRGLYVESGPGAIVHAHPPGTVPEDGGGPGRHGVYVVGASLREAAERAVASAREPAT